jgi:hypothetical protein
MQTLEVRKQEQVDLAAAAKDMNNPLKLAGCVGAAQVLSEVIGDLQKLRKASVSE